MSRAIVIVLDSFGIGALADATRFGDEGSNTLGHIDQYCHQNQINFSLPNFLSLGLGLAFTNVNNQKLYIDQPQYQLQKFYSPRQLTTHYNSKNDLNGYNVFFGAAKELSAGKDTSSGHWEIMCCPVIKDFGYFTDISNSFPQNLLAKIVEENKLTGYLGNCHASGTNIINDLGDKHLQTLKPIFYTSPDSVFQIAAHEEHFGLDQLYSLCLSTREILEPYNIARVIARPFNGNNGNYQRTKNRRDYSLTPPMPTVLEVCTNHNGQVVAIGKIDDIFAQQGITTALKAYGLPDLIKTTVNAMNNYQQDKTIIMTNLVDFDMVYGHRRDVVGYKTALEWLDQQLPIILNSMMPDDLLLFTADHGCDPTWPGFSHTREHIPIIGCLKSNHNSFNNIGIRSSFCDIGASILQHLNINNTTGFGQSFLNN